MALAHVLVRLVAVSMGAVGLAKAVAGVGQIVVGQFQGHIPARFYLAVFMEPLGYLAVAALLGVLATPIADAVGSQADQAAPGPR